MISGFFKLIFRRIIHKPLYPSIMIIGITLGFISTLLVVIWLRDELSYDSYNDKSDRIYRLTIELNNKDTAFHWNFARSWYGWLKNIKNDVPGIESMVRISRWQAGVVKVNDKVWQEELFYADASLTDIFSLHFIRGNPKQCLSGSRQVILDKSTAEKYFGNEDPLNKIIYLYCSTCADQVPYQVTGVFEDIPPNAHVHFHIIGSFEKPEEELGWAYYYLLLDKNTTAESIRKSFDAFSRKYRNTEDHTILKPSLQKISDIHLFSSKDRELEVNGSMLQIKIICGLALFMLFVSLFNYFNLRYIYLLKDSKPVRIFQFLGAKTKNIIAFLLSETLIYGLFSGILAVTVVALIFPYFNNLMGKQADAGSNILGITVMICLTGLIIISILAGALPYFVLKLRGIFRHTLLQTSETAILVKAGKSIGI